MKNILNICFQRGGTINRKEYLIGNIILLLVCIGWIFILPFFTSIFIVSFDSRVAVVLMIIPMLVFFSYVGLNITWKRGRDFLKTDYLIYIFSAIIIVVTWSPVFLQIKPEYLIHMFHPAFLLIGGVLNILWFILWLLFQFTKTKKQRISDI